MKLKKNLFSLPCRGAGAVSQWVCESASGAEHR